MLMKGSWYVYLKVPENLTDKQYKTFIMLSNQRLYTNRAYFLKLDLQEVYFADTRENGKRPLNNGYNRAIQSRIDQGKEVAKTVKNHWNKILDWFDYKLFNGVIVEINRLLQQAKRRARKY